MITQLKFVGIPTSDQARALKFYTEQLGFEVATDQPFDDRQRWIELRIGNATTRVVLFTPEGHEALVRADISVGGPVAALVFWLAARPDRTG